MYIFLITMHVIASIFLIAVILLQAGRGGGVSELFGGSSTQTIFGTSTQQFLVKMTAAAAVLFIVTSLSLAILSAGRSRSLMESGDAMRVDMERAMEMPAEEAAGVAEEAAVVAEEVVAPAPAQDEEKLVEP